MGTTGAVAGLLIFLAALLFSSVGHSGASGYLAAMAICGVAPPVMRPTALALNVLVASIATWRFGRAGCVSWRLLWPFAATSVPMAALGGAIDLPGKVYRVSVGLVLIFGAAQLLRGASRSPAEVRPAPTGVALAWGAAIGLLSGLSATGGGIFLTPIVLICGYAGARQAAGLSAAFNLANSIAGLIGRASTLESFPAEALYWAPGACLGGWIGASFGSRHLGNATLRRLLAAVLVIAGLQLLMER